MAKTRTTGNPAGRPKGAVPKWTPVEPLDWMILEILPDEGAMVFNAYPDGRTTKQISDQKFGGNITPGQIGSRLVLLGYEGLVIDKKAVGTSGYVVYQITAKGRKALSDSGYGTTVEATEQKEE